MFDLPVKSLMEPNKLIMVSPETTVSEAAGLMASKNTGAVLVVDKQRLVGIFTERDVVFRVLAKGQDAVTTPLRDVMTSSPIYIGTGHFIRSCTVADAGERVSPCAGSRW